MLFSGRATRENSSRDRGNDLDFSVPPFMLLQTHAREEASFPYHQDLLSSLSHDCAQESCQSYNSTTESRRGTSRLPIGRQEFRQQTRLVGWLRS